MPIPFLVAGAVAAGVLGIGGHISAKETNERAESISRDAKRMYDDAKESLETAQENTEGALLKLGYSKKDILASSMKKFVQNYAKVQEVSVRRSIGLNELSNFTIDKQEVLQMQKMSDIYSDTLASGATGAAAGAIVALAASGELVVVTDCLGIAGTALAAGELSAAAGIAGSALSFGAAMTPLGAIAAPVLLFTGISASMKADENLEKAQTMHAQAEEAVEKMKVSETLCVAIADRAEMFDEVLSNLNVLFAECTEKLDQLIRKKERRLHHKKLTSADFSENDLRLLAVTGALAGAVKSVIDTPILTKEGTISKESQETYDAVALGLPEFEQEVSAVRNLEYDKVPNTEKQGAFAKTRNNSANSVHMPKLESGNMPYYARWIGSIILFILGIMALSGGAVPIAAIWIVIGLNLCPKTYPIARKFERWLIAIIIWLFGASSLFSGLILVAAALILVGMNICPATSEKTMEKERKIWSKINNSLKK